MENYVEQSVQLDKLLSGLNSNLICGASVCFKIQASFLYRPNTKEFNNKKVIVDPNIVWDDLRIFDEQGNVLIDLSKFGFTATNLVLPKMKEKI